MKYFLTTIIINDGGDVVATLEDREISADDVIVELGKISARASVAPEKKKKVAGGGAPKKKTEPESKGKNACGACHKHGHNRKTCPNISGTPKKEVTQRSSHGRSPCAECGSIGTRHFKNCSSRGGASSEPAEEKHGHTINDTSKALSRKQYDDAREAFADGMSSDFISMQLDDDAIDVQEVRDAVKCETYELYLQGREK